MKPIEITPPANSCDSHAHILFGPDKYPYIADKVYTADEALPEDYWRMAKDIGISRAVITAPSAYGTNNSALLDTIALDPRNTRGVASVAYDIEPLSGCWPEIEAIGRAHWQETMEYYRGKQPYAPSFDRYNQYDKLGWLITFTARDSDNGQMVGYSSRNQVQYGRYEARQRYS